jgi:hypothetical protein
MALVDSVVVPEQPPNTSGRPQWMFLLAASLLLLVGFILPHGSTSEEVSQAIWSLQPVRWTVLALWAVIVAESLPSLCAWRRPDARSARLRALLVMVLPPLRMVIVPHASPQWLWLPGTSWVRREEKQFQRLELQFAVPMLVVAVLILPVIAAELFLDIHLEGTPEVAIALHALTSIIWFSFALEFIILLALAPRKFEYVRSHWINLLVILLPVVAFLRTLVLFRVLQLAKAGKVVQIGKLFQTVRLRVLLTRAHRFVLLINLIERILLRHPEFYLKVLRTREQRKQKELEDIRTQIAAVEARRSEQSSPAPRDQDP